MKRNAVLFSGGPYFELLVQPVNCDPPRWITVSDGAVECTLAQLHRGLNWSETSAGVCKRRHGDEQKSLSHSQPNQLHYCSLGQWEQR